MVGEQIRKIRKSLGWSQEELASRLNISRQSVSRWEDGSVSPNASNIAELCKVFNVPANYFFDEVDQTADDSQKDPKKAPDQTKAAGPKDNSRSVTGKRITIISSIALLVLLTYCSIDQIDYEVINMLGGPDIDYSGLFGSLLAHNLLWLAIALTVLIVVGVILWKNGNGRSDK